MGRLGAVDILAFFHIPFEKLFQSDETEMR